MSPSWRGHFGIKEWRGKGHPFNSTGATLHEGAAVTLRTNREVGLA
jgi:hypothetical protein